MYPSATDQQKKKREFHTKQIVELWILSPISYSAVIFLIVQAISTYILALQYCIKTDLKNPIYPYT